MKLHKILPVFAASLLIGAGLSSCGGGNDSKKLNIVCIDAGYGKTWINKLAEKFKTDHPDITVNITALYESESLIQQHLASKSNNDDLYISVGSTWKSYAATGSFAELDDLLEDTVDGVKVKDKVADEFKNSIYFTKSNGTTKCYRLPFTSGIGGIFYNAKMFETNGWDTWLMSTYNNTTGVPETYDQLVALCQKINADSIPVPNDPDHIKTVKPFTYGGTDTDYFDYTVFDWWGQIAGKDAITNFLKYESADNFDASKNSTYAALKTATERWFQLFGPSSNYYITGNNTTSAADAQKQFINGEAAMMFNGDWLYNESLQFTKNGSYDATFKLALMKTPVLAEANPEYVNTSYIIGEDQYIAIPASSKHKDLAKDFIKLIVSNEGCETFTKEAHGFLAYNANYDEMNINDSFLESVIDLRSQYTSKFTNFSSNRKYLTNLIDIWSTSANRPFLSLLNGSLSTVDRAFQIIASTASSQWTEWTNKSK